MYFQNNISNKALHDLCYKVPPHVALKNTIFTQPGIGPVFPRNTWSVYVHGHDHIVHIL